MKDSQDAYGHQLYDFFKGRQVIEVVERDDGLIDPSEVLPKYYLSEYKDWTPREKLAAQYVKGRVLDIGCGFGPVLKVVKERGGHGIGLTLSAKQAERCKQSGLEAYVKDWKDVSVDTFGMFDGIVSVGAFEHFCSVEDYLAGKQDQIYDDFFRLCHELLPEGGRLFLQTMMWGKNAPEYTKISLTAEKGSNEYIIAVLGKFFPGSWLPFGEEHILRTAAPYFELISDNNGRLDYIETMEQWGKVWNFTFSNFKIPNFSFPKVLAVSKVVPRYLVDKEFRSRMELLRNGYDKECFRRELLDHQRLVFQKK